MGKEPLQWHPAFCSSLQIELEGEPLQFMNEYNLTRKPLQIDVLVIKKTSSRTIQKSIGKIFRTHNIVEFKSPEDSLSINDYYKVLGYACIYQANTEKVMEIPPDEITMSFVTNRYPRRMIRWIKRIHRAEVVQVHRGIYYLNGLTFPTQIVVIKELSKQENKWLSRLRPGLSTVEDLNVLAEEYRDKHENPLYSTCMDVIMRANQDISKEGDDNMCQALYELAEEVYGEKWRKEGGTIAIIELIRKKLSKNCSEEQIADELEIESNLVEQICQVFRALSFEASNEDVYKKWNEIFA